MTGIAPGIDLSARAQGTARQARIAIYDPAAGPSGPSRYVHSLLANIDPGEFEVCIFCHSTGPYEATETLHLERREREVQAPVREIASSDLPVAAHSARRPRAWRSLAPNSVRIWAGFVREVRELARYFQRWPADLIHLQTTGCEEAPVAARLAGFRRILGTFHVDPTYDLEHRRSGFTHRILETFSNHSLHRAIAISEEGKRMWSQRTWLSNSRITTIHNGVDPNRFRRQRARADARRELGIPEEVRMLIGGVGRLDDAKGFRYLIEALALLKDRHDVHLVLAGNGERRAELEEMARRAGLAHRVHFAGFCPQIQLLYDAIDILAAPSLCEALSYAIQEAMCHELPVVASRVGGIPEVVVPGETGFLVSPRNPTELAAEMSKLIESEELRSRMGQAGRVRILGHFTEAEMIRRTLAVYRELLHNSNVH